MYEFQFTMCENLLERSNLLKKFKVVALNIICYSLIIYEIIKIEIN